MHTQNELSVLEFIHTAVETFDRYFESVVSVRRVQSIIISWFTLQCELDVSCSHVHTHTHTHLIAFVFCLTCC